MSWRDAATLAFRGALRRLGRSVLTVVAVLLAAALLTALLSITATARSRVLDQLTKGGPLSAIRVVPAVPQLDQLDQDNPDTGGRVPLEDEDVRAIAALRAVRDVIPVSAQRIGVVPPEDVRHPEPFGTVMVGADLRRVGVLPVTVLAGRLPHPRSTTEVAVTNGYLERVGHTAARAGDALGDEIEIVTARGWVRDGRLLDHPHADSWALLGMRARVRIVGVVAQEAGSGQLLAPARLVERSRAWAREVSIEPQGYAGAIVVARGVEDVRAVRRSIAEAGFSTSAPQNLIASVLRYLRVVEIVLGGIAVITCVVAGLGIANALLAAVRERAREIGVLKAIGARDRDIRRVFLIESSVLGALGGGAGTVVGWALAQAVGAVVNRYLTSQGLAGVSVEVTPLIVVIGVVGSALLALMAGTVPAARAARTAPRAAVAS